MLNKPFPLSLKSTATIVEHLNVISLQLAAWGRAPEELAALVELCILYRDLANRDVNCNPDHHQYQLSLSACLRRTITVLFLSHDFEHALVLTIEYLELLTIPALLQLEQNSPELLSLLKEVSQCLSTQVPRQDDSIANIEKIVELAGPLALASWEATDSLNEIEDRLGDLRVASLN